MRNRVLRLSCNLLRLKVAGATIGRGLNMALATLVAGALGVGAHYLAVESGKDWRTHNSWNFCLPTSCPNNICKVLSQNQDEIRLWNVDIQLSIVSIINISFSIFFFIYGTSVNLLMADSVN